MNRALLAMPLAAALLAGGCGSDDSSTSSTQKTAAQKPALPKTCSTNADGTVVSLSKSKDTGKVRIKNVGTVPFTPSKDIAKGKVAKGDRVYLTYVPGPNNAKAGAKGTCLLPYSAN